MLNKKTMVVAMALTASGLAQADGFALGTHAGLMGGGVAAYITLSERMVLQAAYNQLDVVYNTTSEDLELEGTFQFDNGRIGLDFYPFHGSFRLSTAVVINNNNMNLDGRPNAAGVFELNDNEYLNEEVENLNVQLSYPDQAFYVGLGWGNPVAADKGLGVTFDVGVVYTGAADVSSRVTCTSPLPGRCQQMQDDLAVETETIKEDLGEFEFWPLVQLGLSYQF